MYVHVYVKYYVRFFSARCFAAAEYFFSHFRPRGKLACHGYIMKYIWISAELRGGARRIERRLAGSIWQGIAIRLPETSRSLGTPQFVFQNFDILINFDSYLFFVVLFVKKWPATQLTSAAAQQPPGLNQPQQQHNSCLAAVAANTAVVAVVHM